MTADENFPENETPDFFDWHEKNSSTAAGRAHSTAIWVERNRSRERVYEAAKGVYDVRKHIVDAGGRHRWEVLAYGLLEKHIVSFWGDTLAEALERMGEAMEMELTKESK